MAESGDIIVCRAAVVKGPGQPLEICQVEVDPPKAGEVRIKVLYTGVCHTDAGYIAGQDSESQWPAICGHEGGGVIESVGEGVTSVQKGDHVIPLYIPQCDECKFCLSGKTNLCSKIRLSQGKGVMPDGTSRFRLHDTKETVYHFMGVSTFSEFTVVPEIAVAKINTEAPL